MRGQNALQPEIVPISHTTTRIHKGGLFQIHGLFKSMVWNKREISVSRPSARSLLDVSYCTRWITLISRLF